MRFNITINQKRCLEAGLNCNQAALMALFTELAGWATEKQIKGKTYWYISRRKVVDEIPLFYEKTDTVYRAFRFLSDKGFIEYINENRCDYVRLTPQGGRWNFSEIVPNKPGSISELGNESEQLGNESEFKDLAITSDYQIVNPDNSEMNPTYNIYNNTNDEREGALAFLKREIPERLNAETMKYQTGIGPADFARFCADFDATVEIEMSTNKIAWNATALLARFGKFARSWVSNNQGKAQGGGFNGQSPVVATGPARKVFNG